MCYSSLSLDHSKTCRNRRILDIISTYGWLALELSTKAILRSHLESSVDLDSVMRESGFNADSNNSSIELATWVQKMFIANLRYR
jgi:hypothetical protein